MKINKTLFGEFEGMEVYRFNLTNANGNCISIINYGAAIISWEVMDKKNLNRNIVAGFDKLDDYLKNDSYMGCIVGRYANRIANGKFKVDDIDYSLTVNNASYHLHGGNKGFDKVIWHAIINENEVSELILSYLSKDGEEGYPGNLKVKVSYKYTDEDELEIEYFAETDKPTPVNLTSHGYFNLSGDMTKNILDHSLQINADYYTPVNESFIPTGEFAAVEGTAFDFREMKNIATNFERTEDGFDHNYILNSSDNALSFAGRLMDPDNELSLSVLTTEPGLHFYSGNQLTGNLLNRDGKKISKHAALCLETQHFPDSPNQPHFPSTILIPGKNYSSKTVYKFNII